MIWQLFNSGWNDALRQVGWMESTHRADEGPDSERWKPKRWNLQPLPSKVAERVCDPPHREGRPWRGPSPSPRWTLFQLRSKSHVGSKLRRQNLRRQHDTETSESKQRQHQRLKWDLVVAYLEQFNPSPLWLLSVWVILILGHQGEQKRGYCSS